MNGLNNINWISLVIKIKAVKLTDIVIGSLKLGISTSLFHSTFSHILRLLIPPVAYLSPA